MRRPVAGGERPKDVAEALLGPGAVEIAGQRAAERLEERGGRREARANERQRFRPLRDPGPRLAAARRLVGARYRRSRRRSSRLARRRQDPIVRVEQQKVRGAPRQLDDQRARRRPVVAPRQPQAHPDDAIPRQRFQPLHDGPGQLAVEERRERIGRRFAEPPRGHGEMHPRQVGADRDQEIVATGIGETDEIAVAAEVTDPVDFLLEEEGGRLAGDGAQQELVQLPLPHLLDAA